ncbi:MAG: hypothetical protein EXS05_17240, partial [Planctomycetaceae bacterium]|nr:hypothetical protein [Planctomycetaceae bacterium]
MPRLRQRTMRNLFMPMWLLASVAICSSALGQERGFRDAFGIKGGGTAARKQPADLKFELVRGEQPGEAIFQITAIVGEGRWIYSMGDNGGPETIVEVKSSPGIKALEVSFVADHDPKVMDDPDLKHRVEKFFGKVVWTQRYRILPGTDPADVRITGRMLYQVCDESACRSAKQPFDVQLAAVEELAGPVEEEDENDTVSSPGGPVTAPPRAMAFPGIGGEEARPLPKIETRLNRVEGSDDVVLEIRFAIPAEHYIYSMAKSGGRETVVKLDLVTGLEPVDDKFTADRAPHLVDDEPSFEESNKTPKQLEEFFDQVTWTRRFRVTSPVSFDSASVAGVINYQICGNGVCRTLAHNFVATPEGDATPLPMAARGVGLPKGAGGPAAASAVVGGLDKSGGLLWYMLRAIGFGFGALLTPCAFPMVPITVSFFHKQSEKAHHKPVTMAAVYCGGIIATFTILGIVLSAIFGPAFLNQVANNPWFNLGLALLLVFFALNLLGMFEIRIPSWLLTYTATQEGRGGMIGVLFMALTFTLTSFTCTFAFVGTVLIDAANGGRLWPAAGLLAFSAAFALPFFFLALFPSFLQRLPKSGGWMNAVKVIMGLLEMGAAFKFFSVADLSWHPVAWVFDYELVMSAWMII